MAIYDDSQLANAESPANTPAVPPAAPPSGTTTYRFQFRGSTAEFFRIWIVNIALSLVTLGFYAPWAKVRTKRYFYANTYLDDANFEYHARPLSILFARIFVLAILGGGALLLGSDPSGLSYTFLLFLFLPWAWVRGLSFNARNSSYRNVHFSFRREYGFPYLFYALSLIGVGIFMLPWLLRSYHQYKTTRHQFGKTSFSFEAPSAWSYVGGYAYILSLLPIGFVYLGFLYSDFNILAVSLVFLYIAAQMVTRGQAIFFRLFWNNIRTENGAAFHCNFSSTEFANLLFMNFFATILSLGLLTPWAKVRKIKFLTEKITLTAPTGLLDNIAGRRGKEESAFGEELDATEGFDFDIGIF